MQFICKTFYHIHTVVFWLLHSVHTLPIHKYIYWSFVTCKRRYSSNLTIIGSKIDIGLNRYLTVFHLNSVHLIITIFWSLISHCFLHPPNVKFSHYEEICTFLPQIILGGSNLIQRDSSKSWRTSCVVTSGALCWLKLHVQNLIKTWWQAETVIHNNVNGDSEDHMHWKSQHLYECLPGSLTARKIHLTHVGMN